LDEVFRDPHVLARGMVVEVDDPEVGKVRQVGIGAKLSDTPGSVRHTQPRRGQHTEEVLRELGLSPEEIAALRREGAIA
jgi:crotonobetainyl-CoA:carnitine CoA-transferase CaiB-like acyl-CoA transferase